MGDTCQALRVEHGQHVLLDEVTLINGQPGALTEDILNRRERTQPIGEFDGDAPRRRWNVQPRQARPPDHHEAPKDNKQHETEMNDEDRVREEPEEIRHG